MTEDDEQYVCALERAARCDPRFKVAPHPDGYPETFTYVDIESGLPEPNPIGTTAEEAFARAYALTPIYVA